MINSLRSQQKTKVCTVYHNYNISTKNFDGKLLYQLFLASGHLNKRGINYPQPKQKVFIRPQSKRSRVTIKSQSHKNIPQETIESKNTNLMNLATHDNQNSRKSTQQTRSKLQIKNTFDKNYFHRQLYSTQKLYESMYKSMQTKREIKIDDKQRMFFKPNNSISISNKIRRNTPILKKQHLKIQDFLQAEIIEPDPWIQGKLGGFSAEFISVISNNKRIYSYEGQVIRQIASLTKIMTCITSLFLAKKYQINIKTQQIKVTRNAAELNGTSAQLQNGDVVNLSDMLYGMMLPSGNDAAQALADFFDKFIQQKQKQQVRVKSSTQKQYPKTKINLNQKPPTTQSTFIRQMNNLAQHLNMKNTHFDNAHGLSNKRNYSTANDIAQLCHYAMKNNQFRSIVKCKEYETKIFNSRLKINKKIKWVNTNKLLSLDYCEGIKTGITPTAGPCMAAFFQKQGFPVIIVILNAKNKSKRFQQVKNLYQWAYKQTNI